MGGRERVVISEAMQPAKIRAALKNLRVGKTCGDDCLCSEMLKTNHEGLVSLIARVFTDILHGTADVPATWTVSRLIVLYKKGEASLPKKYRPVAIIPSSANFSVASCFHALVRC